MFTGNKFNETQTDILQILKSNIEKIYTPELLHRLLHKKHSARKIKYNLYLLSRKNIGLVEIYVAGTRSIHQSGYRFSPHLNYSNSPHILNVDQQIRSNKTINFQLKLDLKF